MSEVFQKVQEVVSNHLQVEAGQVKMESLIVDELGADSLDQTEIAMQLEDHFGVTIPEEKLENNSIKTVGDLVAAIEEELKSKAG